MLRLNLLGSFEATVDGTPIEFRRPRMRALLAYLAAEQRPVTRESLATLLWPDSSSAQARNNFRVELFRLRQSLDKVKPNLSNLCFVTTRVDVALTDAVTSDIADFSTVWHGAKLRRSASIDELQLAASYYRDSFLADFPADASELFDEWLTSHREHLHVKAMRLFDKIIDEQMQAEQFEAVIPLAQRQIALDSLHQPPYRQLMRAHGHLGQSVHATRIYKQYEALLEQELGIEPSATLQALLSDVQRGDLRSQTPPAFEAQKPEPASTNLSPTLPPLFGRKQELASVRTLFDQEQTRLVSLIGMGGIGKTTMAQEIGQSILDQVPDGVWLVSFDGAQADEITTRIGDAIGINFHGGTNRKQQLFNYLRTKKLLLILDNFEDVLDEALLVSDLLRETEQLKVLCTSREPLNIKGEWLVRLEGLEVPPRDADDEAAYSSVKLFVNRARQVAHVFELSAENVHAVANICRMVDGSPLGIELAATWMHRQTPSQLVDALARSPRILQSRRRDLPERQRSMERIFQYTWQRLSPEDKTIMARMTLFNGSFSAEAAETITGATLFDLELLIDRALVQATGGILRLHPLVRSFILTQEVRHLRADSKEAFSRYFLMWANQQQSPLEGYARRAATIAFSRQYDNVAAAWEIAVEHQDLELLNQSYWALVHFWRLHGMFDRAIALFEDTLQHLATVPGASGLRLQLQAQLAGLRNEIGAYDDAIAQCEQIYLRAHDDSRAWALLYHGAALWLKGERDTTRPYLTEALDLFESSDNHLGISRALIELSAIETHDGNHDLVQQMLQRTLTVANSHGDAWAETAALTRLCILAEQQRAFQDCKHWGERAMALCKRTGDLPMLSNVLNTLGHLALMEERWEDAKRLLQQAIKLCEDYELKYNSLFSYWFLGAVLRDSGETDSAEDHFQYALNVARELGNQWWESYILADLAKLTASQGRTIATRYTIDSALELAREVGNQFVIDDLQSVMARA